MEGDDALIQWADETTRILDALEADRSRELPAEFIRASAFWYMTDRLDVVPAPGDANNLKRRLGRFEIYTANTFLVSKAILRMIEVARDVVTEARMGHAWNRETLHAKFSKQVLRSVVSAQGIPYSSFPTNARGNMAFGNHEIDVNRFVGWMLWKLRIDGAPPDGLQEELPIC
jgi:hypothetical protein